MPKTKPAVMITKTLGVEFFMGVETQVRKRLQDPAVLSEIVADALIYDGVNSLERLWRRECSHAILNLFRSDSSREFYQLDEFARKAPDLLVDKKGHPRTEKRFEVAISLVEISE